MFESLRPPPVRGNPWMGPPPVRHRVRPRPREDPHQDLNDAVSALRLQLDRYARSASATDAEVREGIIRMSSALLSAVTPGLGNLTVRTPREVEWLSVRYLDVRPATAHELTWLFEEARYSTHRMPPTGIARAQQALTLLLHDLERWAVHASPGGGPSSSSRGGRSAVRGRLRCGGQPADRRPGRAVGDSRRRGGARALVDRPPALAGAYRSSRWRATLPWRCATRSGAVRSPARR